MGLATQQQLEVGLEVHTVDRHEGRARQVPQLGFIVTTLRTGQFGDDDRFCDAFHQDNVPGEQQC